MNIYNKNGNLGSHKDRNFSSNISSLSYGTDSRFSFKQNDKGSYGHSMGLFEIPLIKNSLFKLFNEKNYLITKINHQIISKNCFNKRYVIIFRKLNKNGKILCIHLKKNREKILKNFYNDKYNKNNYFQLKQKYCKHNNIDINKFGI